MSLRFFSGLNSPPLVVAAGAAIVVGLPALEFSTVSLAVLKGANVLAFLTNVAAVSVPGRLDGLQDQAMRSGDLNPSKPASSSTPLVNNQPPHQENIYSTIRTRTLLNPSGWAFAIWGPIYLGEATFVAAQFLSLPHGLDFILPQITAPFVAFNLMQSLWCASFRPSYSEGWNKWVSVAMLGGTAYSLSFIEAIAMTTSTPLVPWWYFLPLTVHFGWTTAATLVNLNGSVAMEPSTSDATIVALGHASALTATALGLALAPSAPAYGLTVAWALAACADGMAKRLNERASQQNQSESLKTGAKVQRILCWTGSALCVGASIVPFLV